MQKLDRTKLLSLEAYAAQRAQIRAEIIEHKKARRIALGPHATLIFEDFVTMQYQVQEMLRAERIFEAAGIDEEIAAYNPLIPDGTNWKATFLIEYEDVAERRAALAFDRRRTPGLGEIGAAERVLQLETKTAPQHGRKPPPYILRFD
jgi:hypothetical protein